MNESPETRPAPRRGIDELSFAPHPIEQFERWYADARARGVPNVEAMSIATATADGAPSARMVLLRGCDERGLVFFTNYSSRKGREIESNPRAALCFHWHEVSRQDRIEGAVERVSARESDEYFDSRPIGSRLSAIASPQSEVVANREELERAVRGLSTRYRRADRIPRPAHWGGYRVIPNSFEFWQSAEHRLHDRLRYRRVGGSWILERVAP
jgi:pyridoxamine 5'-phosphate oxidase